MAISRSGGSNPKRVIFTDNKGVIHEVSKVMYRNQNMTKPIKVWPDMTEFYYLKVTPSEQGWGTVVPTYATKRKIECDNSQLSLTAIPYEDYDFNYWSVTYQRPNGTTGYDSWTDNPHTITNDITLKDYDYSAVAWFKRKPPKYYFDFIDVYGTDRFTSNLSGLYIVVDSLYQDLFPGCKAYRYQYSAGSSVSVTTNPKEGNQFTKAISYNTWTSGTSTQTNTFSFTFPSESENKEEIQRYAVYYDEKAPTAIVTIRSANTNQGTVTPSITNVEYEVSSTVYTMRATAKSGYLFDHWSDGNTNAYRQVVFNQAIRYEYVAYFKAKPMAHLKVTSNDTNLGIVTPDYSTYRSVNPGSYTLKATPKENCGFVKWSDDNTDATRTVTCLANNYYSYTAYFERINAVVNVSSNNTSYGTVTGGGIYHIGDVVTLEATPLDGYVFIGWTGTDDNTKPNTTLTITENTTYNCVASFGSKSYGFIGDDKVSLNGSTPSIISYGNGGFDPTNTYLRADMNASNYGYGTGVRYLITSKYGRNYRAWYNNSTRYYFDNNDPIRILMEAGDTTGPCISKIEVECYSGNLSGQVFTYTRDSFVNEVTELGGKTFTSYIDIPVKNGIYGDNVGQNIIVYFENE